MFYDEAKIFVRGGDGGNGAVAFTREKYVPRGGPSGGDGGRGGNVVFKADEGLRTLVDFKYRQHYRAEKGAHGQGKNKHGKDGSDLVVRVPVGTLVKDALSGRVIADLVRHGQEVVIARGGRGGRGNARFATSRDRTPTFAEKGEPGEERWLLLELKLLADAGLVGFPNAGKSTLISRVSAARPRIAPYPFTTLTPNLGVVSLAPDKSFVLADIPGLIEGAHRGAGLGYRFLKHVERTKVLVHVLDGAAGGPDEVIQRFRAVSRELELYDPRLTGLPQVVAINKMDLAEARKNFPQVARNLEPEFEVYPISAQTGEGLEPLVWRIYELVEATERE